MPWFGHRILVGEVPYRDFFLHLPPLQPLAEAAIEAIGGRSILAGRFVGALVHLALAALTSAWLVRASFRSSTAAVASLAALAVATSDDTEILDLYNPHATLAAIVAGVLASYALDASSRRRRLAGVGSGVLAAASLWTKQTVGLGAAVAVPAVIALLAWRDVERRPRLLAVARDYAAGWGALSLAIGGWLALAGAFGAFVEQVFVAASASKGSLVVLASRPWAAPFELGPMAGPALLALALAITTAGLFAPRRDVATPSRRRWLAVGLGLTIGVALLAGSWYVANRLPGGSLRHVWIERAREGRTLGTLLALYGSTLIALRCGVSALVRRLAPVERERLLLAVVSAALAVTHLLSYAGSGAAALPALAFVAACGVDATVRAVAAWPLRAALAVAVATALVSGVVYHHVRPFQFAGWSETGPWASTATSIDPALRGMRLSPETADTVDAVVGLILRASDADEPIFTFPVYPIFNWLADRPSPTFASIHWLDVTPDAVTDRDAERILAAPPVVVVRQSLAVHELERNEAYFRAGRESGMRRMQTALDGLLDERYRLAFVSHHRRRGREQPIEVWVRADRAEERGIAEVR